MTINIEQEEARATAEVAQITGNLNAYIAALPVLCAALNTVGSFDYCYFYPNQNKVISRVRTRADFAPIRALRHGKWDKAITEEDGVPVARYDGIADCGTMIICYVCELPPSCKIIHEEVQVDAHTEIRTRVECSEEREVAAATEG